MRRSLAGVALLPFSIGVACAAVNVNTAQQSELQRVKGLDRHKAKAIIEHRAQHGPFRSLDDLEKLPGFTREVLTRAGPEIAFTGDAYVPAPKTAKATRKPPTNVAQNTLR